MGQGQGGVPGVSGYEAWARTKGCISRGYDLVVTRIGHGSKPRKRRARGHIW